jgi:hypothetical protein
VKTLPKNLIAPLSRARRLAINGSGGNALAGDVPATSAMGMQKSSKGRNRDVSFFSCLGRGEDTW